jgi:hypothetical protein
VNRDALIHALNRGVHTDAQKASLQDRTNAFRRRLSIWKDLQRIYMPALRSDVPKAGTDTASSAI